MYPVTIAFSGEDTLSEALARRCVSHTLPETEFCSMRPNQGGNAAVRDKFSSYLQTARGYPFLVILDLDDLACPPALRAELLRRAGATDLPQSFVLSVVAREAEAWVLGDRTSLASFLAVDLAMLPVAPEHLPDPKATLVQIGRNSRTYRADLCPRAGTSAKVGAGYNDVLSDFVQSHWRPDVAALSCPTLQRTLERLRRLTE